MADLLKAKARQVDRVAVNRNFNKKRTAPRDTHMVAEEKQQGQSEAQTHTQRQRQSDVMFHALSPMRP